MDDGLFLVALHLVYCEDLDIVQLCAKTILTTAHILVQTPVDEIMQRVSIGSDLCGVCRGNSHLGPRKASLDELKGNPDATRDKFNVVPGLGSGPIYQEGRRSRAFSPSITGR